MEVPRPILAVTEYQSAMNSVIAADRTLAVDLQTAGNTRQSAISSATNADVSTGSTTLAQATHDANSAYATAVGNANVANETVSANSLRDYKLAMNASADALAPLARAASQTITELEQAHYTSAVTDAAFAGQSPFHQQEAEIAAADQTRLLATHTAEAQNATETATAETTYQTSVATNTATLKSQQAQNSADAQVAETTSTGVNTSLVPVLPIAGSIFNNSGDDSYSPTVLDPNTHQGGGLNPEFMDLGGFGYLIPQLDSHVNFYDESDLTGGPESFPAPGSGPVDVRSEYFWSDDNGEGIELAYGGVSEFFNFGWLTGRQNNRDGHHWVPGQTAQKMFEEGVIGDDALKYFKKISTVPENYQHGRDTIFDVTHKEYDEHIETLFTALKNKTGEKIGAQQAEGLVKAILSAPADDYLKTFKKLGFSTKEISAIGDEIDGILRWRDGFFENEILSDLVKNLKGAPELSESEIKTVGQILLNGKSNLKQTKNVKKVLSLYRAMDSSMASTAWRAAATRVKQLVSAKNVVRGSGFLGVLFMISDGVQGAQGNGVKFGDKKDGLEGALLEAAYQSAMGPIVESSVAKSYDYLGRTISAPDHLHTKGAKHGITLDGESFTPWNGTGGGPSIMPKKTPPPKYPWYNPWGWWQ